MIHRFSVVLKIRTVEVRMFGKESMQYNTYTVGLSQCDNLLLYLSTPRA